MNETKPLNLEPAVREMLGQLMWQNVVLNATLQQMTAERDALKHAIEVLKPTPAATE